MKYILISTFVFFSSFAFAQEVIEVKGKVFIAKRGKLKIEEGKTYQFIVNKRAVDAYVKKLTRTRGLFRIVRGKIALGEKIFLNGISKVKKPKRKFKGAKGFKRRRLALGASYNQFSWGELKTTQTPLEDFNTTSIDANFAYYITPKLSLGFHLSYGLEVDLLEDTLGSSAPLSFIQVGPELGYSLWKNLRVFTSLTFTEMPTKVKTTSFDTEKSISSFGAKIGLDWDLFITKSIGVRPRVSYQYQLLGEFDDKGSVNNSKNGSLLTGGLSLFVGF